MYKCDMHYMSECNTEHVCGQQSGLFFMKKHTTPLRKGVEYCVKEMGHPV